MRIIRVGFPNTTWDHEVVQDFPALKEPHQFNGLNFSFGASDLQKCAKGLEASPIIQGPQ